MHSRRGGGQLAGGASAGCGQVGTLRPRSVRTPIHLYRPVDKVENVGVSLLHVGDGFALTIYILYILKEGDRLLSTGCYVQQRR